MDSQNKLVFFDMNQQTDILVIGAGIAGAGIAAQLAKSKRVIILDMEERPGYHSTGRSAAMFAMNYGNDPIKKLNRASWEMFQNLSPTFFPHPVLADRGVLYYANVDSKAHLDELIASADDLDFLSAAEAKKLVPIIDENECAGVGFERDAKDLDVAALHQGWLKEAKTNGGIVVCDAGVTAAKYVDGVWQLETSQGVFEAPIVVNAAGAWADEVAQMFGVAPVGLVAKRRSIATLPSSHPEQSHKWPMLLSAVEDWYMKPDAGSFLVSPADEDPVPPHDVFVDDMVLAEGLFRFSEATTYEVTHVDGSWAGLRVFTPDKTPVCGYASAVDGFFWLAGQGGYGIQTSPALSLLAAHMVLRTSLPSFADQELIDDLSPNRATLTQ
ncbi:NAD(P)/FAD-dependent oxidoreductase [Maritalea sp.]|uniref:NAD(P)/FAD-dependent oxidoreductase n=1 Tax=Maritalea sp. TaxID=2003361 RepID=UPI003EF82072